MFENSFEEFDVSAYDSTSCHYPSHRALSHCLVNRAVVQELIEEYAASERDDYAQWGQK